MLTVEGYYMVHFIGFAENRFALTVMAKRYWKKQDHYNKEVGYAPYAEEVTALIQHIAIAYRVFHNTLLLHHKLI